VTSSNRLLSDSEAADQIVALKFNIIEVWVKRAREEISAARAVERLYLVNTLPKFLDQLALALRSPSSTIKTRENAQEACKHDEERSNHESYTLDQVIEEYRILREVLIELIHKQGLLNINSNRTLHALLDQGIKNAARRFSELTTHKAEINRKNIESLFEKTPIIVSFMKGPHHHFEYTNPAHARLLGKVAIGKDVLEVQPEAESNGILDLLDRVYRNGETIQLPEAEYTIGTDPRFFDFIFTPSRNEHGQVDGVMALVNDITTPVRTRALLEKSEKQLRSLEEQLSKAVTVSKIGFFDWDIVHDVVQYSDRMKEDWGLNTATPISGALDLIHPDDRDIVNETIQKAIWDHRDYFAQYRVVRPTDGKTVWIEAHGDLTYNEKGEPTRIFGTSMNITERKEIEIALQESEVRFRTLSEDSPMIIWVIDSTGQLLFINDRWTDYTGRSLAETIEMGVEDLIHPDDVEDSRNAIVETIRSGSDYSTEVRLKGKNGQYRWFQNRGRAIRTSEGKVHQWVGVSSDIHDRKVSLEKSESARKLFQAKVVREKAEKETAQALNIELNLERELRERFVAALTHDLRTPMTATRMIAQLLMRKTSDPAAIQTLVERIVANMDRADRMIRDLLDANRIKAGEGIPISPSACDLVALARSVVQDFNATHGPRAELNACGDTIQGHWDCNGIQRVLENLLENAIKYGDPNSTVQVQLAQKAEYVEISVHNRGRPISARDQDTLFNPYRRTSDALKGGKKGWGIGLTLVKGITEAHQGKVFVKSSREHGTTFTIQLPNSSRQEDDHDLQRRGLA
jgi:PAS domain S-box-containing protein